MTPHALTETDLVDVEELHVSDGKGRRASVWDALVDEVTNKTFTSFVEAGYDPTDDPSDLDNWAVEV